MKHKWILSLPMLFNISSRKGICSLSSSKFSLTKSSTLPCFAYQVSSFSPSLMCYLKKSSQCFNFQIIRHHSDSSNEDDFMDVIYKELTVESFRELIKNSDDEKIIKEILSLYEYQKFDNGEIPSTIKINQMVELMKMPRDFWQKRFKKLSEKEIYLKYKKKMKSLKPKSLSYNELQNMIDKGLSPTMGLKFDPLTGAPIYGEWLNSHFTRLRHLEYRCSFIPNLLAAFLYGQKILIDCDYEYTVGDAKRIIFDLQKAMALNRSASSPFNMVVTGLRDAMLRELLDRHKKECLSTLLPSLSFHEETFTELYKDQKLIYLTPHSDKDLCEYDNDAIYIIGGLSIRSTAPHSFKKASSLKIPNYRFPLSFLPFRAMRGAKSLEIRECVSILLHFKEFGDIKEAVSQGIDVHRIKTLEELEQEQRLRFKKLQSNERRYTKRVKP